ncbi:MAG TPA: signal peptidase I [Acidimicrobiales bacterium]|nr:signal peptidase I [Acidimicrobiales bacterium]
MPPNPRDPTLIAESEFPVQTPLAPDSANGNGNGGGGATSSGATVSKWAREFVVVLVVALVLAVLLRLFVVQTFFIPSGSMEPTLKIGDRILVNKLSYHLHSVHRGDIVVFKRPADENCGGAPVADLVKRVIGLPGETISVTKGIQSYVVVDGKRLDESWLPSSVQGQSFPGPEGTPYSLSKPYVIPADHYFVMGDNRTQSCDSRYWGPISRSLIVGKVELRIWPISTFHIF